MKIVLLQDVYKKGVAGEVVDVADGFARNYLIPQGLALKATPLTLKRSEELRAQATLRRSQRDQELSNIAEMLQGVTLLFPVKAGETGKLYGSVTLAEIVDALKEKLNIEFDRRRVGDRPLRELGEHRVPIRLSAQLTPAIRVVLYREEEEPPSLEDAVEEVEVEIVESVAEADLEIEEPPTIASEEVEAAVELPEDPSEETDIEEEEADDGAESDAESS